jgi:hypothetical protein
MYPRIGLGFVSQMHGDFEGALVLFRESLQVCRELRNLRGCALSLAGIAGGLAAAGTHQTAAQVFGASEALREGINSPIPAIYRPIHEQNEKALRGAMDGEQLAAAWREGRGWSLEEACRACA